MERDPDTIRGRCTPIQLTSDYEMKPFDCGDSALNGFLQDDAKLFLEARLAKTYLLCDEDKIVGYYCLLNDKLSKQEMPNNEWRKIKKLFPHAKHFGSYPSVKLGRFAVSVCYRNQGWGREMLSIIKRRLKQDVGDSQFRFLTVDAYLTAVPFYERNGFKKLTSTKDQGDTQAMYFDILSVLEP